MCLKVRCRRLWVEVLEMGEKDFWGLIRVLMW